MYFNDFLIIETEHLRTRTLRVGKQSETKQRNKQKTRKY